MLSDQSTCCLINPSKGEMGVVSKNFLEEISNKLNNHLCHSQWHSTSAVIEWFKAIENKKTCKFIKFDIAEFYPSISAELLEKSINFARSIIKIEDKIIDIINMQENPCYSTTVMHGLKKSFVWCNDRKLRWGRGLRACQTLFVRQAGTSDWYKKRRVL